MLVQTTRFGEIEVLEEEVFYFKQGIPGFKDVQRFVLIEIEDSPFQYMQSIDLGEVAFIVASPFDFFDNYDFTLSADVQNALGLENKEHVKVINIISIRTDLASATINLGAPIILNTQDRLGIQYILTDGEYSIHQPLFASEAMPKGGK